MATVADYKIVVVEPNPERRNYFRIQIADGDNTVFFFETEPICLDNLRLLAPDLVVVGQLPIERIYRFLYAAKHIDRTLSVLVISGEAGIQDFIRVNGFLNTRGITSAITSEGLKATIGQFKAQKQGSPVLGGDPSWPLIVGIDPEMVRIKKVITEIAQSGDALLIEGENGTGKDLIARAVHFTSTQRPELFVKIDSGAITKNLLGKDLAPWFQYPKKKRKFEDNKKYPHSNRGTLFFDEIGQMPFDFQRILLRLFDQQVTGNPATPENPSVQIVASTSEDIDQLTEMGKFRKDLFYRINVFRIQIPPLRERLKDIPLLAEFFTDKYCDQLGKGHYTISPKTLSLYGEYEWPGNVRELENMVKSTVVIGEENQLIESLSRRSSVTKISTPPKPSEDKLLDSSELESYVGNLKSISLKEICREFTVRAEIKMLRKALDSTNWNRKKAAGLLNISYKSLLNKIKEYNLTA